MGLVTITEANTGIGSDGTIVKPIVVQVGEAVTKGAFGYQATDSKYYLSDCDALITSQCKGMFLSKASTDGYAVFIPDDGRFPRVAVGATLTVGMRYVVGTTPGSIMPDTDLTSGDYVTFVGIAVSSGLLEMHIQRSGVAVP